jgi:hypothetical protein
VKYRRPTVYVDGRQCLVSRIVMARVLRRPLLTSEIVHHRDGNPFNNDPENLQVVSRAEHKRIHADIGHSTRLTKKWQLDEDAIVRRYQAHEPIESIAASIGCSTRTIERAIHARLGVDLRRLRPFRQREYLKQKEQSCS